MIWLTWRQQRFEAALTAAAVGVGIAVLLLTRQAIVADFNALGIANCLRGLGDANSCANAYQAFKDNFASQQTLIGALTYLPMLVGVLLGASIAVEMEQGAYRLAWAQSVTRWRWVFPRLGLPVIAGLVLTGAVAGVTTWWMQPANSVQGPVRPGAFDIEGMLPMAYMLLAFAITAATGVLWRRTVPAVGLGLAGGVGIHLLIENLLRAHLMAPLSAAWRSGAAPYSAQDWVIQGGAGASSYVYIDSAGHRMGLEQVQQICGQVVGAQSKDAWASCLRSHHLAELVSWQPAGRFWPLQTLESALVVATAFALLFLAVWWLRTRTA